MKNQGIYIQKFKDHQTKKIYNNGYLLIRYLFQPLTINFKNEMVNDINQHFCEGWCLDDLDLSNEALLNRTLQGEKPLAIVSEWEKDNLKKYIPKIDTDKFDYGIFPHTLTTAHYLAVASKGKMKDLFDLETLKKDYSNAGINIDIVRVKDKTLKDYFIDWDHDELLNKTNLWETGLILGYPIENTISVYKNGIRVRT